MINQPTTLDHIQKNLNHLINTHSLSGYTKARCTNLIDSIGNIKNLAHCYKLHQHKIDKLKNEIDRINKLERITSDDDTRLAILVAKMDTLITSYNDHYKFRWLDKIAVWFKKWANTLLFRKDV